jgi:hypothetical protein
MNAALPCCQTIYVLLPNALPRRRWCALLDTEQFADQLAALELRTRPRWIGTVSNCDHTMCF